MAQVELSQAEQIIGTFCHKRIQGILPEIQRQALTKKDFVASAATLAVDDDGRLALNGIKSFKLRETGNTYLTWQEAEAASKNGEGIDVQEANGQFPLSRTAERQLCQRVGVGLDFVDRLRNQGQADLAASILSERLRRPRTGVDPEGSQRNTDRFLVRMLDSKVRAIVSDSYRIIDNIDLFFAAAQKLQTVNADVWQMRLTPDSWQMLAVSRSIKGEVRLDRTFDPGDGWQSRWANLGNDTQYAAMSLSNSETGLGGIVVNPAVMTRVCANFNVWAKTFRAVHLGRKREEEGLIESAEVQAAESRLVFLKVQAAIETVFDAEKFAKYIETLNAATQRQIAKDVTDTTAVTEAVERVAEHYAIADDVKNRILGNLLGSRDLTQYGTMQAMTEAAHAYDKAEGGSGEETASGLEIAAGDLIHLSGSDWRELVKA